MKHIEVQILNPNSIGEAEKMAVFDARLTQRAEKIGNMEDLINLYNKSYTEDFVKKLCNLPHPTLQKMEVINVAVVGASRRFLAQITRHQNEVKFMSGSLQYSDYSAEDNKTGFVVPYDYIDTPLQKEYIEACKKQFEVYQQLIEKGIFEFKIIEANDAAGYAMPQGLRNVLIISATPYQWKHMIGQRICRRNTLETRYVMLKIWEQLYKQNPSLFGSLDWGCLGAMCREGSKSCCNPFPKGVTPADILKSDFSKIYKQE